MDAITRMGENTETSYIRKWLDGRAYFRPNGMWPFCGLEMVTLSSLDESKIVSNRFFYIVARLIQWELSINIKSLLMVLFECYPEEAIPFLLTIMDIVPLQNQTGWWDNGYEQLQVIVKVKKRNRFYSDSLHALLILRCTKVRNQSFWKTTGPTTLSLVKKKPLDTSAWSLKNSLNLHSERPPLVLL